MYLDHTWLVARLKVVKELEALWKRVAELEAAQRQTENTPGTDSQPKEA